MPHYFLDFIDSRTNFTLPDGTHELEEFTQSPRSENDTERPNVSVVTSGREVTERNPNSARETVDVVAATVAGSVTGRRQNTTDGTGTERPDDVEQSTPRVVRPGRRWPDVSVGADVDPFQTLSQIRDIMEAIPDRITSDNADQFLDFLAYLPATDIGSRLGSSAVSQRMITLHYILTSGHSNVATAA